MKQFVRRCVAHAVARLPAGILTDVEHAPIFEKRGFHVTRDHFYEPVPNASEISHAWDKPSELIGVDLNLEKQIELLEEVGSCFLQEYNAFPDSSPTPTQYGRSSGLGLVDGAMLYSIVRKFKPKRYVEIGSGVSTLCAEAALNKNGNQPELTTIDPYPPSYLRAVEKGRIHIIESRVELVPVEMFQQLQADDILFIDSSHVVRIGGDVIYELLEVLPRLKIGTVVHIHDIFLPSQYPKDWILKRRNFWTEQYMVQAFLAFNQSFVIMWSSAMMQLFRRGAVDEFFPRWDERSINSSLWLRRVR